jgi:hypothetical protein
MGTDFDEEVGRILALEKRGWIRGEPQDGGVSWWTERPPLDQAQLSQSSQEPPPPDDASSYS